MKFLETESPLRSKEESLSHIPKVSAKAGERVPPPRERGRELRSGKCHGLQKYKGDIQILFGTLSCMTSRGRTEVGSYNQDEDEMMGRGHLTQRENFPLSLTKKGGEGVVIR